MKIEGSNNFILRRFQIEAQSGELSLSSNHLLELHYIEDITKSNIMVAVTINDTETALVSQLFGLERCYIEFSDHKDNVFGASMVIYDIKDRMIVSGKKMKATLYLISPDAVNNSATKISRRFGKGSGESTDEIVEDLLTKEGRFLKSVKTLESEKSSTKISFISPYWDPYTIISWLAWRSIPEQGSGSDVSAGYLFYETPDSYHFKSMDSLVQQDSSKIIRVNFEDEGSDDDDNFIDVSTLSITGTSDVFRGLNLGSYTSVTYTLDMKDFSYEEIPFNVNEYYRDMKKLNEADLPKFYEMFGVDSEASRPTRIMAKVLDTAMYTEGTYTQDLTKQLSQAMIRNQFFFNQSATFEYEGTINLQVGQVVEVQSYAGKSLEKDAAQSGKYIVGKIYRQFVTERDMMSTRVTIYRDSLG
jgi:hypothetical protein